MKKILPILLALVGSVAESEQVTFPVGDAIWGVEVAEICAKRPESRITNNGITLVIRVDQEGYVTIGDMSMGQLCPALAAARIAGGGGYRDRTSHTDDNGVPIRNDDNDEVMTDGDNNPIEWGEDDGDTNTPPPIIYGHNNNDGNPPVVRE